MTLRCLPMALLLLFVNRAAAQDAAKPVSFEKGVLPILQAKCLSCHGEKKQRAGLDLRTKAAILSGGESGASLKPGYLSDSPLWEKIVTDKMPPGQEKLTAAEKEVVKRWIESGAPADESVAGVKIGADVQISDEDRDFWAFRKPTRPVVPSAKGVARHPVDAFVLAALEAKGLTLSPEAERHALLRRVTLDLTGQPPTPEEVTAFIADADANAYEKVVDRLLASPRYGERWARHWLDVAGYADSEGILDADYVRSSAWRYRDWVIRAMNDDMPYDRFLQEQIAGDELHDYWSAHQKNAKLPAEVIDGLIATGFLRCASDTSRPDFANIKNAPGYYFQTLDDTVKIVVSSTMGLTIQCAKCHSHKYDPIPQTDYYRLQAIFMSGYRPAQWVPQVQRKLHEASAAQEAEAKAHNAKIDAVIAGIKKKQADLQKAFAAQILEQGLAKLPTAIRDDVRAALETDAAKRSEVQKYLVEKFQSELKPTGPALLKKLADDPAYKKQEQPLLDLIKQEEAKKRTYAEIRAFYDLPGDAKTHLLRRGDYLQPGPEMTPGVLGVLANAPSFAVPTRSPDANSSGRRLAFARWLTQSDHPLTARVLVNRLWLHHFGRGLVATPDNFGRKGSPPSHPELLDWLASEFVAPESGKPWSMKSLHRLLVTSRTYRQASAFDPSMHAHAKEVDPDNRLLWRQRLRRLEAEAIRDSVLSVSGTLNPEMYGVPVPMVRSASGEVNTPGDGSGQRRSIYLQVRRSQPLTFLQLFDQPVIETNCTHRETSTVPSQALQLINSEFMTRQAEAMAHRALKEAPTSPAERAVLLAFGRAPSSKERAVLQRFLQVQSEEHAKVHLADAGRRALTDLCHMLLSANEFAYVD